MESASTGDSFSADLSYSSIYLAKNSDEWPFGLYMEIAELTFKFRKDIRGFIEMGVDIPIVSFNSGFMDNFLKAYHNTFGFPDYGRSNRPRNAFFTRSEEREVLL
jgi:uncharacterized protein DUF3187